MKKLLFIFVFCPILTFAKGAALNIDSCLKVADKQLYHYLDSLAALPNACIIHRQNQIEVTYYEGDKQKSFVIDKEIIYVGYKKRKH